MAAGAGDMGMGDMEEVTAGDTPADSASLWDLVTVVMDMVVATVEDMEVTVMVEGMEAPAALMAMTRTAPQLSDILLPPMAMLLSIRRSMVSRRRLSRRMPP